MAQDVVFCVPKLIFLWGSLCGTLSGATLVNLMLACSTVFQPTRIEREIELFESSTRPARVATNAGDGFLKGMGNPQGTTALISELIAGELGVWFGLSIPPFAVVNHCQIEIPMRNHHLTMAPPMFCSKAVEGIPRDGSDTFLKRLLRPEDVSKLVVFDTWIRNSDRYSEDMHNSDNLLYVTENKGRKYSLVPIDHSHCFVGIDFETDLPSPQFVIDPEVYGLFPEFAPFIKTGHVADALERLDGLEPDFVQECVNSIPAQWLASAAVKENIRNFICDRAKYVVETLAIKLVPDPQLPGMGNNL